MIDMAGCFDSRDIVLYPRLGSDVSECIRQACITALTEQCPVKIIFNDTPIYIDPVHLLSRACDKWHEDRKAE